MEPLCQTQMPADGQHTSELLHQIETQETKVLEAEQRCRKLTNDLQKVESIKVLHDQFFTVCIRLKNVGKLLKKTQQIYVDN